MSAAKGGNTQNTKTQYKKGQHLYRAGDRADRIFILQQGLVSVTTPGMKQNIDLYKAVQPQILGEEALRGEPVFTSNAVAVNDTSAIEVPIAQVRTLIDCCDQQLKQLFFGMLAKQTAISGEILAHKKENEAVPCPPEGIAKMFSVIFQIASYTGTKNEDAVTVNWPGFKKYCQRIFLESPVRLEQAMYMLVNLKIAQLEMVKDETDPEAPEDLGFIHFKDLSVVGRFADYCRKNKGMKAGSEFDSFFKEIEHWNRNGRPEGMPDLSENKNKFQSQGKKKAA